MKWTKDMEQYLIDNYNKLSIEELAKNIGVTKSSITNKAFSLKITNNTKNKNRGNINLFENINSEESAYWLGFIYADGYIIKNEENKKHHNYELGIELQESDITHLEKFNKIFNNYYKITTRARKMDSLDILNGNEVSNRLNKTCLIRIYNKKIVNDLINNNIVQNKTNSNIFPIINNNDMFIHFLRGYIDGDGSYVVDNKNRYIISIQGNNKKCFEFISNKLLTDFNISSYISKDRDCWKLNIRKKSDVLKLIDLMFNNANIYLDRKYDKVKDMKKAVFNRNIKDN